MLYKIYWGVVALCYAPFFKKFSFPSHIGVPIFTYGLRSVSIHKRVRIMPGVRIETHKNGTIVIEEDVSIGQNFHITSAGNLTVGKNTTISGNVFVTNIDHEYTEINVHILDQPMIIKETKIGSNCFLGFGVAIQAGTVLGNHCVVGASSVVRGIFPDYSVIVGIPARVVKRYNVETLKWEKTNADGSFLNI
ncbi:lipopolysaccharide biosynthesis protein [Chryseobacterium sp. Leaf404]|uniref:DapH/DapD/GlmU-related protein n=1 Tax=unclassified Chryseobacterium TaxID=2593645 RepID=UPI0006F21EB9|nr:MULTISPECIES: DapH/DapD/GlmU-related protein [unclassified Chryseobacterium]KQT17878.1 lipopolysaccharide biosynthesis protein [Chryseobacterium sp. Leaf404]